MRKPALLVVCVVAVIAALSLVPDVARAEGKMLGRILASDAGSSNNFNTGYLTAGCANSPITGAGSCDQAFKIPTNAKITIQCDEAALVNENVPWVDAGNGKALTAAQLYPTATGAAVSYKGVGGRTDDGGVFTGGVVSIAPAVGASSVRCRVYERLGTE